jgi:hypothetical protein
MYIEELKKFYDPFPPPTEEVLAFARQLASFLRRNGIVAPGVIAAARAKEGGLYIAMSTKIQQQAIQRIGNEWATRFAGLAWRMTLEQIWACTKVNDDIANVGDHSPGCAEKKIVSTLRNLGKKMVSIGVVAYPDDNGSVDVPAHIVQGHSDGTSFIAPCESCLKVARSFLL